MIPRRRCRISTICIFLLFIIGNLCAQEIALIPFANDTSETQYEVVAQRIITASAAIAKITGSAIPVTLKRAVLDPADLNHIRSLINDNTAIVLTGRISAQPDGSVKIETYIYLSPFDTEPIPIVDSGSDLYEVIDATDRIIRAAGAALVGKEIQWGGVEIYDSGEDGAYRLAITDDTGRRIDLGADQSALANLPVGTYDLLVVQDRPLGEHVLYSGPIAISSDEVVGLTIEVPGLIAIEKLTFDRIDREIAEKWLSHRSEVKIRIEEAIDLLTTAEQESTKPAASSETLSSYLRRYVEWQKIHIERGQNPASEVAAKKAAQSLADETASPESSKTLNIDPITQEPIDPEKRYKPPKRDRWIALTSISLLKLGSFAMPIAAEARIQSEEANDAYLEATANVDGLWESYHSLYLDYMVASITSLSVWISASGVGMAGSLFLAEDAFRLSDRGKNVFALSYIGNVVGDVLSSFMVGQSVGLRKSYHDYSSATDESDINYYWDIYQLDKFLYSITALGAYGLWTAGSIGTYRSLSARGAKQPILITGRSRTLIGVGSLMTGLANVSSLLAAKASIEAKLAEEKISEGLSEFEAEYNKKEMASKVFTYTSYGLWAAGAGSVLWGLYFPGVRFPETQIGKTDSPSTGLSMTVEPTTDGVSVGIRLAL